MDNLKDNLRTNLSLVLGAKSEKLAVASYKVSDFISDKDPIKWEIRSAVISLTSYIPKISSGTFLSDQMLISQVGDILARLAILCEIAKETGGFSRMNFSILKSEFDSLRDNISALNNPLISEKFFELPAPGKGDTQFSQTQERPDHKGHIKDTNVFYKSSVSNLGGKDQIKKQKRQEQYLKSREVSTIKPGLNKERKNIIVDFLRKNGLSSIRDIATAVKGCGEKTIQRELSAMVGSGTLKRLGERRWSKYSLV